MDLNRLTRDADDLIRKVVSRYNQLYVPAGTISQLELDLMLDDLRKLYDTFKNIGQINLTLQSTLNKPEVKVNNSVQSDSQAVASATPSYSGKQFIPSEPKQASTQPLPEAEPVAEKETGYKPEYKSEPEADTVFYNETKEELIAEPEPDITMVEAESEIPDSRKRFQDVSENNDPVNTETATAMLADKFNTGGKSLSETLAAAQAQGAMGSRVLFQPISDLTTGIGLNDKFSFISDLFGNNAVQYEEAIHRINKAVNIDEANWILQKYHTAVWDHKPETLVRLKDFVKRRFI